MSKVRTMPKSVSDANCDIEALRVLVALCVHFYMCCIALGTVYAAFESTAVCAEMVTKDCKINELA